MSPKARQALFRRLNKLIADYVQASINYSWAGSGSIQTQEEAKPNLERTKQKLNEHIAEMKARLL